MAGPGFPRYRILVQNYFLTNPLIYVLRLISDPLVCNIHTYLESPMAVQILPSKPDASGKEHFFLRIFDSFADPLAIYDRDFRILKVNQALLRFYQRSAGDVIDKYCYEVFHGRNSVCTDCHVREVFRSGERQWREMAITLPDGSSPVFEV